MNHNTSSLEEALQQNPRGVSHSGSRFQDMLYALKDWSKIGIMRRMRRRR